LLSDHRLFVERIFSVAFVHELEILLLLANCLLQESDLFEAVFSICGGENGLCCLGANYRLGVFEHVLFSVICPYLCLLETNRFCVVSVGEPKACTVLHRRACRILLLP
jgi:hypothetical protein